MTHVSCNDCTKEERKDACCNLLSRGQSILPTHALPPLPTHHHLLTLSPLFLSQLDFPPVCPPLLIVSMSWSYTHAQCAQDDSMLLALSMLLDGSSTPGPSTVPLPMTGQLSLGPEFDLHPTPALAGPLPLAGPKALSSPPHNLQVYSSNFHQML
jgi:hypothetical protein